MSVKRDARKLIKSGRLDDLEAYQDEVTGWREFYRILKDNGRPLYGYQADHWAWCNAQAAAELRRTVRTGQPYRDQFDPGRVTEQCGATVFN